MARIAVPELVATIRERAGLTQEALARELGVSFPTVNAWERGRSHPRQAHVDQLCAFADRLGISRGLTVLVIDDDPVSCAVLESLLDLSELPVTTITAQNGSLGLVLCGMLRPDLVLLDILMPGIDGIEVSRMLRNIEGLEKTQIVFITAASDGAVLDRARETGNRVLVKPVLRATIDELLAPLSEDSVAIVPASC